MSKVKSHELSEAERKKILNDLFVMIISLDNIKEAEMFFKDLLTPSEQIMIARRIQIAKMLLAGELQENIRNKLKVGFTTITQVERWLNNGFGGYKLALKKGKKSTPKTGDEITPFSLEWLRKKYPTHFILLNLLAKKANE
jgi:TrpR-related protein YerC/YecD